MGNIVQMSVCCTQRMKPVQNILKNRGVAISNYNWRPAKLFEGSTKANISLSILIDTKDSKVYSTSFLKWNSEERENLMKTLVMLKIQNLKMILLSPNLGIQ